MDFVFSPTERKSRGHLKYEDPAISAAIARFRFRGRLNAKTPLPIITVFLRSLIAINSRQKLNRRSCRAGISFSTRFAFANEQRIFSAVLRRRALLAGREKIKTYYIFIWWLSFPSRLSSSLFVPDGTKIKKEKTKPCLVYFHFQKHYISALS